MKTLIVEDDFTSRLTLQEILKSYGATHIAVNGKEAIEAVKLALESGEPYNLICLDIMMPEMDGQETLRQIREIEDSMQVASINRAKIMMTTSHSSESNIRKAIEGKCDYFLVKPVNKKTLIETLRKLKLII